MPQPPNTLQQEYGLSQKFLDENRLRRDEEEAKKQRQAELDKYLSDYEDDPVSQAIATSKYRMREQDAQTARIQQEEASIASEYDDPVAQAVAIGKHRLKQIQAPEAQKAFADREQLEKLRKRDTNIDTLDRMGMGNAFLRETIGSAVNTTEDLAAVVARLTGEKETADQLHRESENFQDARQRTRSEDLSPWLSRMYGGTSQSMLQMAATPGGAAAKILGSGVMAGSQGLTTAEDAGLEGAARYRFAGSQALFEAGVAALGQKIFGPGIESRAAGQTIAAQTWRELGKNIGMDALKEMPEEAVTAILQDVSSKFEGVSPDLQLGDFITNAIEASVQAAMMAPMANSGNAAGMAWRSLKPTGKQPVFPDAAAPKRDGEPEMIPIDERIRRRDAEAAGEPSQPVAEPSTGLAPEVESFILSPSRKTYDAAIKAGMPPIDNPEKKASRDKYASDLLVNPPEMATPAGTLDPATPPATTQYPGAPDPTAPEATNPDITPDDEYDQILNLLKKGEPNEAEVQAAQASEANFDGQGQTEGVLDQKTPPLPDDGGASPDQSQPLTEADPVSLPEQEPPGHTSYSSGLTRSPAEADEAIKSGTPVGVSAFSGLTAPMRKKLVDYANADGKVFVDSGAFTAFKKGKEVDWDKILFTYHEMTTSVAPEKRANVTIVAPDIVGNHDATLQLQEDLQAKFQTFFDNGATVIFPVQQGGHGSLAGNFADLTNTFSAKQMDSVTVGVPFNAKAWTQEDVLEFMRSRENQKKHFGLDLRPFHLLGAGPAKVEKLFEAAEAEGLSTEGVSADALPKKISQRKRPSAPKAEPPAVSQDAETWWDKTLTGAGRANILKQVGLILPNKVLWKNMKPAAQAKVRHMMPTAGTPATTVPPAAHTPKPNLKPPAAAKPIGPVNPANEHSLRSIVLANGGISTKALKRDYNLKELKANGLLGIMRISGIPVDIMAQQLEASGDLRTPPDRSPADWLMDQLQANADGARAEYSDKDIEARLEAEREAYERVKEYEAEGLDELRKRSEEEGVRAANAEESGEEISANETEVIDTSFDFGANVKAATPDEDAFTLKRPEKPKPKAEDFGTNPNTKQGGLFDAGKKGDLPGQELLFNSDPGDLNNPKTQENKPKSDKPESDIKAAMRKELEKQAAEEAAAKEPAKPKSIGDQVVSNAMMDERGDRKPLSEPVQASVNGKNITIELYDPKEKWAGEKIGTSSVNWYDLSQLEPPISEKPSKEKKARKPRTKIGEKLGKKSKETGKAAKKAWDDFLTEAEDFGILSGINNKALVAMAKMVRAQIADGVVKFADLVARIAEFSSPATARKLSDYLEAAWDILSETNPKLDPAGRVTDVLGPDTDTDTETAWSTLPGHFAEQFGKGETYTSITEARSEASEIVGHPIKPGTADAKRLDELIEYGIVQAGRSIVEAGGTPGEIFDKLVDLYTRQPTLGVRDSNSMKLQAYSTPVPLAYLASQMGHITAQSKVYEPTAGNGMLLIGADVKNVFANELDPDRAQTLRDQGFNVTQVDAVTHPSPEVDTVIANPPFGPVPDAKGKPTVFNIDGLRTKEADHAISLQALKGMKPDGYAVLIIAAKGHNATNDMDRRQDYLRRPGRLFYDALYEGYDVTSHITIDGSLYSRQGASFPVDVIVLRPLGTVPVDQKRATPWAQMPRVFNNWGELRNAYFNDSGLANAGETTGVLTSDGDSGSPDLSTRNQDDVGRLPGQNENATPLDEGDVRTTGSDTVVSPPVDGKTGSRRGGKKTGGPRTQPGLSPDAATKRGGTGNVSTPSKADPGGQKLDSGTGSDRVAGAGTAESAVDPESHQSNYEPSSKNKTVDTLIPTNLQDATQRALEVVEDTYGPVDAFVQKELGYKKGDKYFTDLSAEQVDALALAIHAHKNGGGMIVGDMTGVGKGRVAAAMMRYADMNGMVPIFVTEKPDLFGDMYRDLADVGSDTDTNHFFALNTNESAGANAIALPNGRKLDTSKETNMARLREGIASLANGKGFETVIDGVPTKMNAVFTMYSQLQTYKGDETERRELLRALMPHAYLILDESHNAGGTTKERTNEDAPPDRAAYTREIVQMGIGAMYLSATFAKRPNVMDLYSKTDMAKAVEGDVTKLAEVIQKGGLPLQQVVSAMLSERGQYIRREKSFEGVEFAKVNIGVDLVEQDKITDVFRGIRNLDKVVKTVVDTMAEELTSAGEQGSTGDAGTGDAGIVSTSFGSILWNAVDQMLFALKADKSADQAIEAWNGGKDTVDENGVVTKQTEVPIMAVDNTMEGMLDDYVKENNLKVGDVVNLSFKDILHRYLERSRILTIDTGMVDERGKPIKRKERLTDDQLNVETEHGNALTLFNAAKALIDSTELNAPASPIDWMRYKMGKAGMKVAEITGRKSMLIYNDSGVATLGMRPRAEKGTKGKQETIRKVNDGSLDGILLNRSGATGVSIHASSKFKNQKPRHMIIVQPAKNIDEFMQMLGRVNRTGQVVLPRYSLAMSDSPSELRPAAVLSKKLASLNASVTAKSKGAVGFDVTDVMNQVGGQIVAEYLVEHQELALELEMDDVEPRDDGGSDAEALEDIVRTATGRAAILPIIRQREFWEDITALYNARIEELNALNANPLLAKTLDLDAKTLSTVNLFKGKSDGGPFEAPAEMERMDVRNPGKPMTADQVKGKILEFYGVETMDERWGAEIKWVKDTVESMRAEMIPFRRDAVARYVNPEAIRARETVISEQADKVENAINEFSPGSIVNFVAEGQPFSGVVIGFTRTGKSPNPVAPSRWMIEIAINDAAKKLTIPVSRSANLMAASGSLDNLLDTFETMQTEAREKRWIGTGNLMAAFAQLSAQNGKLIFYTDDQGNTNRGILMPRTFNAASFIEDKPVRFDNSADIMRFFDRGGKRMSSIDNHLTIVNDKTAIRLVAPKARSRGGKYTLNPGILAASGGAQFVSVGNQMVLRSADPAQQKRILNAVLEVTAMTVKTGEDHTLARDVVGIESPGSEPDTVAEPEPESDLRKSAREAKEAVEAQKAENDRQNKIIADELRKDTLGSGLPISDELAKAVAKRMIGSIRLGIKQFDAFIKELRADLDEGMVRSLKPTLIRTWNAIQQKHGLQPATDAAFEAGMSTTVDLDVEQAIEAAKSATPAESQNSEPPIADSATPPAATPEPATPAADGVAETERTYSTKNAFSEAERQRLDMGERTPVTPQPRKPNIELAAEIGATKDGAKRIDNLIQELLIRPRSVTPIENDLLNYRNAELGNEMEAAWRKQIAARESGDATQEAVNEQIAAKALQDKAQLIELILEPIGTEAGRNLQARKAIIASDYSMERSVLEFNATHGRPPNKPGELEALQKQHDVLKAEMEALEKLVAEQEAKINDLESNLTRAHEEAVERAGTPNETTETPAPSPEPATPAEKSRKDKAQEKINNAYKRLKAMLGEGTAFSVGGVLGESGSVFIDLATGYSELGVLTLADFLNRVGKRMGPAAKQVTAELTAAWKQVKSTLSGPVDISPITNKIDILDPETIGRAARDLHRYVIERDGLDATAAGREAAVDAVHEILLDFVPDLTRNETARAMSGIGIYSELSKDEIEVVRRDQKAQLLSLAQIDDWMAKTPPPATGQERAPVSDEQRLLRRMVNEAKKASGISTTTEGMLRSALDAAKRMLNNRITDLEKAIAENTPIKRSKRVLTDDSGELQDLQAKRDDAQKRYNEAFGKNKLSDEQRINLAEKALDRAIEGMESDLKAGKLYKDAPKAPVTSAAIEAKRAALAALKANRDELRRSSGQEQERSDAAFERHLLEREAVLFQRIINKDFLPAEKKPARVLTDEMLERMMHIEHMQQELRKQRKEWAFKNRHIIYRAFKKGPVAGAHMIRKGMTTLDQSLIGRQGFLLGIAHPVIYGKAMRKAWASNPLEARSLFPTKQDLFNTHAELDADTRWVQMEKIGKVAVTDVHGGVNREEGERYTPDWFDEIPGIGGSERAGSAFINTQRRLVFRSLVEKLAADIDGKRSISNAELRVIGNIVNISSGRGTIGSWTSALDSVTTVFFSPRWWASRINWLTMQPIWHDARWTGGEGASTEVRKLVAMEMAKQAGAQALILGLVTAGMLAAFGAPGDDEEWDFYWNWKSPNFGKIRIGSSYVDMTAGLSQHVSYMIRMATGKQIDRWEARDIDSLALFGKYMRGKLSPVASVGVDYLAGKSMGQDEFGSADWFKNNLLPLIAQDVAETTSEGPVLGTALSVMMFFGAGSQTYDARVKERKDITNELRAMKKQGASPQKMQVALNKHLAHAAGLEAKDKLRTAEPDDVAGYQKVIDGIASPELEEAIQKERYDLLLNASGRVSSDAPRLSDDKDFNGSDDKGRLTSRSLIPLMIPDVKTAIDLYHAAYRDKNNSIYDNNGKKKATVWAGEARIRSIYK